MIKILNDKTDKIKTLNLTNHELPFVISIPHSGTYISERMNNKLLDNVIFPSMDWYLPELYSFLEELGFTTIINNVSRYEIDPNRNIEKQGIGDSFVHNFIYTKTTFEDDMYAKDLESDDIEYRIDKFYMPYHQAINNALQEKLKYFDKVYLIDLHSFGKDLNVDFIIGDDDGKTASKEFVNLIEKLLNNEGYTFKENTPYRGGYITRHYGNEIENCETLQIEIWYGAYINKENVKNEQFPKINEMLFKDAQEKMKSFFKGLKKKFLDSNT